MQPQPQQVLLLAPALSCADLHGVGFTVVNFNTSAYTIKCVESLAQTQNPPSWILVLDNGSSEEDFAALRHGLTARPHSVILLFRSDHNLGFARGSNFLIEQLLEQKSCRYLGLLNSDAVAKPSLVQELVHALASNPSAHGMAGGRMHKLRQPTEADTLGISIYGSLMPADRLSVDDLYMGPTGGCCLLTRDCVLDITLQTGYFFDSRFFCYCEDTDLVLRANMLGYTPAYTDKLIALHAGQASSGGDKNAFIVYHGWRNVFWMQMKIMPVPILLRHSHWLVLAHLMSVGRYLLTGQFGLIWRVYRDAFRGGAEFFRERKKLKSVWRISSSELANRIESSFYRKGYFWQVLRNMLSFSNV